MSKRFVIGTSYTSTDILNRLPSGIYIYAECDTKPAPALLMRDLGGRWLVIGEDRTVESEVIQGWNLHAGR